VTPVPGQHRFGVGRRHDAAYRDMSPAGNGLFWRRRVFVAAGAKACILSVWNGMHIVTMKMTRISPIPTGAEE
jgi:hypothetical protein